MLAHASCSRRIGCRFRLCFCYLYTSFPIPSHQTEASRDQQQAANEKGSTRPDVGVRIGAIIDLNQSTCKRRASEAREAHNRESHSHPYTRLLEVWSPAHGTNDRGPQSLNHSASGPIYYSKDVQCADRVYPNPAKHHDAANECKWYQYIQGTNLVGVVGWQQPKDEAYADLRSEYGVSDISNTASP
jgi:hypothetical protein